jgi:hypothetical protein
MRGKSVFQELRQRFEQSSMPVKIVVVAVLIGWTIALLAAVTTILIYSQQTGVAQTPAEQTDGPNMALEPRLGPANSEITVQGRGWTPGSIVMVYLTSPEETGLPDYAISSAVVAADGAFEAAAYIPADSRWPAPGTVKVIAQEQTGGRVANAIFEVTALPADLTLTPSPPTEPTREATPKPTTEPIETAPTATPLLSTPRLVVSTDLNVRSGPGVAYPVVGLLKSGQSSEVTGLSPDRGWWQIKFTGVPGERGWVSAQYADVENVDPIPIVQPPTLPPTPVPTATPTPDPTPVPVVITDWRGEYFNNPNLSGAPVLVRNDPAVLFGWGPNSPGSNVPADGFSARWSREVSFSTGTYRFRVLVDDGARLWVNDQLIIDRWRSGEPKSYTGDITLSKGVHRLRLEYFDDRFDAQVRLDWERLSDDYPDWKAEYFTNDRLKGKPFLVRNETEIDHDWDEDSPAAGLPRDEFSARWTRKLGFEAGTYLVRVRVDDGVRVWFNDELIIDAWADGRARTLEVERQVSQGRHNLKVEYYEDDGEALIELNWEKKAEPINQAPNANAGGPYTVNENAAVTFDGHASNDPDGSIATYEWDFNYNNGSFDVEALGPTATTQYSDGPVTYVVALRVTDNQGASQLATTQVTVQDADPLAEAGGS